MLILWDPNYDIRQRHASGYLQMCVEPLPCSFGLVAVGWESEKSKFQRLHFRTVGMIEGTRRTQAVI